jgi:hypothetical protein
MKMTSELKSKVMSLGNRLAPRMDGDRKAAFVQAWRIVKAGGLELAVKGVSFGSRQEALRRLGRSTGRIRLKRCSCRNLPIRLTARRLPSW